MPDKFRTQAACRIAEIDPQRFNEDVSDGNYPCAPETTAGKARLFDEADIAGLYVYAHLTKGHGANRYGRKLAANYACGVIKALRELSRIEKERVDIPFVAGGGHTVAESTDPPVFITPLERAEVLTSCFDLKAIRETVRERMEEEKNIWGEAD